MGSGYYIEPFQPAGWTDTDEDQMVEEIVEDVTEGVGDTGIKAGIIGELGCSWPWTEAERRSVKAGSPGAGEDWGAVIDPPRASSLGATGNRPSYRCGGRGRIPDNNEPCLSDDFGLRNVEGAGRYGLLHRVRPVRGGAGLLPVGPVVHYAQ